MKDANVGNASLQLAINDIQTKLNFDQKSTLESRIELFLKELNYIPHIEQYHVTIIDQHMNEKSNVKSSAVIHSSILAILIMINVERDDNKISEDLNEIMLKIFDKESREIANFISNSHEIMFQEIKLISPMKLMKGRSLPNEVPLKKGNNSFGFITVAMLLLCFCLTLVAHHFKRKVKLHKANQTGNQVFFAKTPLHPTIEIPEQADNEEGSHMYIERKYSNKYRYPSSVFRWKRFRNSNERNEFNRAISQQKELEFSKNQDGSASIVSRLSTIHEINSSLCASNVSDVKSEEDLGDRDKHQLLNTKEEEVKFRTYSKKNPFKLQNRIFGKIETAVSDLSCDSGSQNSNSISKTESSAFETYSATLPSRSLSATTQDSNIIPQTIDGFSFPPRGLVRIVDSSLRFGIQSDSLTPSDENDENGTYMPWSINSINNKKEKSIFFGKKVDKKETVALSMNRIKSFLKFTVHRIQHISIPISEDHLSLSTMSSCTKTNDRCNDSTIGVRSFSASSDSSSSNYQWIDESNVASFDFKRLKTRAQSCTNREC